MKQKISFLAIIVFALNANCVRASECVDDDCELTPIEIEENIESVDVLIPMQYSVNWSEPVENIAVEQNVCEYDYNCPFDTDEECAVWYKKPLYKTSVVPRAPHINPVRVDDMLYTIYSNTNISGNDATMKPLIQRYNMLMNAADACCTSGIIYKMRENGADDKAVYEFLKDDANYYAVTKRCMVMGDEEISHKYSNGVTGKMIADVRNTCLCKNKQWFDTLLEPFNDIYERAPSFQGNAFTYKYTDGMHRDISVSVNKDVQTTMGLLSACPK